MKVDRPFHDLEVRASEILDAVLAMSDEEVFGAHNAARQDEDPKQRLYELAQRASRICAEQHRRQSTQLQQVLAATEQLELPLEVPTEQRRLHVLLIDSRPERALDRRDAFSALQIEVDVTTNIADGLTRLESGGPAFVIVDFQARNIIEQKLLVQIQHFNLRVPMINVCAWENWLGGNERALNRDLVRAVARLFGKSIPKRLPQKMPPKKAELPAEREVRSKAL